jgi:hypothetical protein
MMVSIAIAPRGEFINELEVFDGRGCTEPLRHGFGIRPGTL